MYFETRETQVRLSFPTSCMTLDMLLNFSERQFPPLLKENNESTYLKGLLRRF